MQSRALTFTGFALAALVAAFALIQAHRHARPTVPKVAAVAALQPTSREVPVQLPDFTAQGWRPVGSRSDKLGGRRVVSVQYRKGTGVVTFSWMADTDGLNDGGSSRESGVGRMFLNWQGTALQVMARGVRGGHQIVLTGTPASEAMRHTLARLARVAGTTS